MKGKLMSCAKCPHHVRHGQIATDGKTFEFKNLCELKIKQDQDEDIPKTKVRGRGRPPVDPVKRIPLAPGETTECRHYPFHKDFDYFICEAYQNNFKSKGLKNGVIPTKDYNYSSLITGGSITDMDLL